MGEAPANGRVDTVDPAGDRVAPPAPPPVALEPAAPPSTPAASLLTGQTAVAAFFALAYWVTIYSLPSERPVAIVPNFWWLFLAIAVFGLTLSFLARGKGAIGRVEAVCLVAYVLLLDWLLFSAFFGIVVYDPMLKFTLVIGGLALVSFAVGIIVFDTLRVAASLPIVILFIGIVANPAGFTAGNDIRSQLIIWMGGILGLSTAAEGLNQWAKIRGDANVKAAVASALPNEPEMAEKTTKALAPAEIGGDLSPAMGVPSPPSGR